ncbi:MAG: transcriptional regulator, MarR family [Frankiales bacterium]|jgi:DNA-binding MarR family transcriptional regulator|nr:transcriptional regulator, MarR family [Frankiales bacterium]
MSARPQVVPDAAQVAAELRLTLSRAVRRLRSTAGVDGVTPSQLSALANLEEHGPLRLRDLAAREGVGPPTASRVVDLLAERRLVVRSPDPQDARGTYIDLTGDGRALLTRTRQSRDALLADGMRRLPPEDLERLAAALPALRALLAEL